MRVESVGRGREPLKDQVSSYITNVLQASKPDLVTGGVAVDLLKVASQVGT